MFRKKPEFFFKKLGVDLHSHLLPDIDDGVDTIEESVEVIKRFSAFGYHKIITSPHLRYDLFPNTKEIILEKYKLVKERLKDEGVPVQLEVTAEYFIDEHFQELMQDTNQLLVFGKNHILVEASFINEPAIFKDVLFYLNSRGLKPIIVHPERYQYFSTDKSRFLEIDQMNILWQINMMSITGYYGRGIQKMAEWMIDQKKVHFLGSDCHHIKHTDELQKLPQFKYFKKALKLDLLNHTL